MKDILAVLHMSVAAFAPTPFPMDALHSDIKLVVFDTETTGLVDPRLLSIGWVTLAFDAASSTFSITRHVEILDNDPTVVNPPEALAVNHITDARRLAEGVSRDVLLNEFRNEIRNAHVFAYNIAYDHGVMTQYDGHLFDEVAGLHEIKSRKGESVHCAVQRIAYTIFGDWCHSPIISQHLHSAFDDVLVEVIVLLYDTFGREDFVRQYFYEHEQRAPIVPFGKYKNQSADWVFDNDIGYIRRFLAYVWDEPVFLCDWFRRRAEMEGVSLEYVKPAGEK